MKNLWSTKSGNPSCSNDCVASKASSEEIDKAVKKYFLKRYQLVSPTNSSWYPICSHGCAASGLTDMEMAKAMKPGLRVIRGRDWDDRHLSDDEVQDSDGNGPGTVMKKVGKWWQVKWDSDPDKIHLYTMDVGGRLDLKILDYVHLEDQKISLGSKLFEAKKFDLRIICEEKVLECHKIVLCCQSDVFERMLSNKNTIEAKSNEVKINDLKPDTMEALLHFIYHDKVLEPKKINIELLCAADKYNIQGRQTGPYIKIVVWQIICTFLEIWSQIGKNLTQS